MSVLSSGLDMTDQSPETTQFFLTAPTPCPYLDGQQERKLFTHLSGRRASMMHHVLSDHGFRRSQNLIYRPACEGCSACRSVRIVAHAFEPGRRHRRIIGRNKDIRGLRTLARATPEQYELFSRYLEARHAGGGMTQMSFSDYEYMIEDTPVQTAVIEYRKQANDELVGVALSDEMSDGLSMVYSFFDPDQSERGMGNFIILDHIARVQAASLPYVYLGYWVKNSPKMAYKAQFQPMQVQAGALGWRTLSTETA